MSLSIVVEGSTDVPVVQKVAALAGWEPPDRLVVTRGKGELDKVLPGYDAAARGLPWFVLRDLDHDAPCPGALAVKLLPAPKPLMCLRIAVRAVEAWLMADPETLATFLHISSAQIPIDPEGEEDPKGTMVHLAGRSNKPAIRKDMLPQRGASRRAGPGYEGCGEMRASLRQDWCAGDAIYTPPWCWHRYEAAEDSPVQYVAANMLLLENLGQTVLREEER